MLALLKADYESNRDYLLWVLKGCDTPKIVHGCDDMTPVYLISLYEHGHPEILPSLFRSSLQNYNASGSEALGGLLSDLVVKSPNIFLDNLKSFPVSEQKEICYSAGLADGGGMAPENLKNLEKRLDVLNDEMADTCIRQIEKANKPGINDNDE